MIPPRDPITAEYPAVARAIDAATVPPRLAAGAKCHPGTHPSELQRPQARFISRRAETPTKILPAAPRRLASNRLRLVASTTGGVQSS
jgi:hypothetical protein